MNDKKTAMVWFESPSGSGHASVAAQTAQALLQEDYIEKVVIVSGSMDRYRENFDFVPKGYEDKVELVNLWPFVRHTNEDGEVVTYKTEDGEVDLPIDGPVWQSALLRKHYKNVFVDAFETYEPDILITEMYPAEREAYEFALNPILTMAKEHGTRNYALVRDVILDDGSGEALQDVQNAAGILNEYYEAVIVRGELLKNFEDEQLAYTLSDTWEVAKDVNIPILYAGWFVNTLPDASTTLDDSEKVDILVSAGGHWSPHFLKLYEAALEVAAQTDKTMLLVTPKNGATAEANESLLQDYKHTLETAGHDLSNVRIIQYTPHFREIMAQAESVLLQGGYNGMLEAIAAGKNTVVSPQELAAPHGGEAMFRAQKFAEVGIVQVVKDEELMDGKTLKDALLNPIQQEQSYPLDVEGPANLAKLVSGSLTAALQPTVLAREFDQLCAPSQSELLIKG